MLQQERSVNTRKAILRAAVELFGSRDIESVTIEELCRSAGIGRSTFYLYFESKDQLLMALAEATAQGVAGDIDTSPAAIGLDDAVAVFIDGLVRRMEAVPPRLAALVMRRVSAAHLSPWPMPGEPVLFEHILGGIVREAGARGELRADIDPFEVGEALAGMTLDALERWAAEPGGRPLRSRLEFRLTTFIDGLRSHPGELTLEVT